MTPPCASRPRSARAFTLVELLTVMAVIGVLLALTAPAILRLLLGRNLGSSAYTLADTFDKARSYAMANNTYVWVGLAELDASSSTPRAGTGTVVLAAVASRDGTGVYDPASPAALDSARVQPVDRPRQLTGLHLASAAEVATYDAGNHPAMRRPAADGAAFEVGDPSCVSLTPFTMRVDGSNQTFSRVVEFNGQGVARLVVTGPTPRAVPGAIEVFMLPAHGTAVDHGGDAAAVQISGLTGATQVYRP